MVDQPIDFFRAMEDGFARILAAGLVPDRLVEALGAQAFDWFEGNIAIQTEGQPALACAKGCPTCCALRVTATAPEIFLIAAYVRKVEATPHGAALALRRRIVEADRATRGASEAERLNGGTACPLLIAGQCVLHPVRTLACRGHAAFAVEQCQAAARGEDVEVAISEPHLTVRALVQNALQAALREAGLAWGLYELNQGLALALVDESRLAAWAAGQDSLAPAIPDLDLTALGNSFDALRRLN